MKGFRKCVRAISISLAFFTFVACVSPSNSASTSTNPAPPPSHDATLSALAVSSGTLSPGFDPAVTSYTVNVIETVTSVIFTATSTETAALVAITGLPTTLNHGANPVGITVTAPDGTTTKSYQVNVFRAALPDNDATLSALTVSSGTLSPSFNPAVTSYTLNVPYSDSVDSVTLTPTTTQSGASVAVSGVPTTLVIGTNGQASITVTAPDGTTQLVYSVEIVRADPFAPMVGTYSGTMRQYYDQTNHPTYFLDAVLTLTFNAKAAPASIAYVVTYSSPWLTNADSVAALTPVSNGNGSAVYEFDTFVTGDGLTTATWIAKSLISSTYWYKKVMVVLNGATLSWYEASQYLSTSTAAESSSVGGTPTYTFTKQ